MNTQIFGCPTCNQRFQVSAEQAGQIVACPSCGQTVEIPVAAFPSLTAPVAAPAPLPAALLPPPATDQVVACGQCTGQFRVTPDLFGQPITCPHCQQVVVVAATFTSPSAPATTIPEEEVGSFADIQINLRGSRKRSSSSRNRAPSFSFDEPEASEPAPPIPHSPTTQPIAQALPAEVEYPSAATMLPIESKQVVPKQVVPKQVEPKQVEPKQVEPKQAAQNEAISRPVSRRRATRQQANPKRSSPTEDTTEFSRPVPLQAPPTSPAMAVSPPTAPRETASSPATSDTSITAIRFTTSLTPEELLPPRFEIEDTTRIRTSAANDFKVVLPDAEGGLKQFDQRILHVEYGGEKVSLIATTPEERQRRRTINNLISVVTGIMILAVAYWLLM